MANLPHVWRVLSNKVKLIVKIKYDNFLQDLMRASSGFPGPSLSLVGHDSFENDFLQNQSSLSWREKTKQTLDDIFSGTMWAVPKKFTTWHRKAQKKFGVEKWGPHGDKMIRPKNNIVVCPSCGSFHERQYLCDTCYEKTREASIPIFEEIAKQLGGKPIEKEMGLIFKGEKASNSDSVHIVEVPVERPQIFSKNLLSRTRLDSLKPKDVTTSDTHINNQKN